jgi:diguanylate cyclase (GGDEF)-like protein/PAS domain S-box-containing protein
MHGVVADREAMYAEDALMWVDRVGFQEDTYFTFSYSPLLGDDGTAGGVLVTAMETTQRVLDSRRLGALGELSVATAHRLDAEGVAREAARALEAFPEDLPFALVYLRDDAGVLRLAAHAGVPDGWTGAPPTGERWMQDGEGPHVVAGLKGDLAVHALSGRPVTSARVMPLHDRGVLVAGLSPSRRVDDAYTGYLDLVAAALARGVEAADALTAERLRADALAELDRAKSEFLQNVSHELRTPLTLVRAPVADLLGDREQPLSAQQRSKVELVQRNAERLLRLVDGLLAFSRASSGSLQPEPVDLAAATLGLAELFGPAAAHAGLALDVDVAGAAGTVAVDADAWERIVLNLLANALKYTESGGVRISLRRDGERAELEVRDTGVGIPERDRERIFERFARVRRDGARSDEGVGIGLALVRQLARRMGGDVSVESAEGRGSRFTVRVAAPAMGHGAPAAAPSPAAAAMAAEVERWGETPQTPHASEGLPVVVCADDSADMREYVTGVLGADHRVVLAADGAEALEAVRRETPDLVLTDIMMPRMDGLELVRALRGNPATAAVPIVLLSARAGEEASAAGLQAGADDYIVKPFSSRELRARVASHIELARGRAALARVEHERQTAAIMTASERRLRAALTAAGTGIALGDVLDDGDARLSDVNPALCELLRRSSGELRQITMRDLTFHEDLPTLVAEQARLKAGAGDHATAEVRFLRGDGEPVWVTVELSVVREEGGTQFVASVRDAAERRRDESRLRYLADHDVLTGLLNRRRFGEELDRAIAECHRYGTVAALLMLDLDGLKAINDLHGHSQGDKLLCGIADLMRSRMRRTDVLGRLGGDEFALLLPHADRDTAEAIARELQHRIRQSAPVLLGGKPARLSASVGIALLTGDVPVHGADDALREADAALYVAKRSGRDCVRVASTPLRREASQLRQGWSERILAALAEDRFELYAQPIVGIGGDERARYELLLRLVSETGEVLRPGSFIPDAERSDLILDIDRWVIARSAELLRAWREERPDVCLHVNLSSQTITTPGAAQRIADALAHAGVGGEGLVYEITETTAISSIDSAQAFAAGVRALGCGLALDDFGSGFASFTYLKHLDYDFVKLDGNLVRDVTLSLRDQRILHCVADLARGMGKRAIAEYVNDDATIEFLRAAGVDYAQGFHLGEPAPVRLGARVR